MIGAATTTSRDQPARPIARGRVERLARSASWLWTRIGLALLLLVAAELASRGVIALVEGGAVVDQRVHADAYGGASWPAEYFAEEAESAAHLVWTPYVYWRRMPYAGRFVNIDGDGLRATWQPPVRHGTSRPRRVFLFGGSTMIGTGARDHETIASHLARLLHEHTTQDFEITNFGQLGYVTSQELIVLTEQLRAGRTPDVVVFYDGINDAYAAFQNQVAGIPQNEIKRIREFNLLNDVDPPNRRSLYLAAANVFVRNSGLGIFAGVLASQGIRPYVADRTSRALIGTSIAPEPTSFDALPARVVESYLANVELVRRLGEEYGFESLFYWQPVVFTKDPKTQYEKRQERENLLNQGIPLPLPRELETFVRRTYALASEAAARGESIGLRDLSDTFRGHEEPVFVDWGHLSGPGNARVASRIWRDVAEAARRSDGARRS